MVHLKQRKHIFISKVICVAYSTHWNKIDTIGTNWDTNGTNLDTIGTSLEQMALTRTQMAPTRTQMAPTSFDLFDLAIKYKVVGNEKIIGVCEVLTAVLTCCFSQGCVIFQTILIRINTIISTKNIRIFDIIQIFWQTSSYPSNKLTVIFLAYP